MQYLSKLNNLPFRQQIDNVFKSFSRKTEELEVHGTHFIVEFYIFKKIEISMEYLQLNGVSRVE